MLHAVLPARQQAHDLVDRLTPTQLAALLDLLGNLPLANAAANRSLLVSAPFSDEPAADPELRESFCPQDSDFWPEGRGAAAPRQPS